MKIEKCKLTIVHPSAFCRLDRLPWDIIRKSAACGEVEPLGAAQISSRAIIPRGPIHPSTHPNTRPIMIHRAVLGWLLTATLCAATVNAEVPRVEMQIYLQDRASTASSRQWIEVLSKAGVTSMRFVNSTRRVPIEVKNVGTKDRPSFKVTGIITARNVLTVPGGRFRLSDREKLLRLWQIRQLIL